MGNSAKTGRMCCTLGLGESVVLYNRNKGIDQPVNAEIFVHCIVKGPPYNVVTFRVDVDGVEKVKLTSQKGHSVKMEGNLFGFQEGSQILIHTERVTNEVRLAITAPLDVTIHRRSVFDDIRAVTKKDIDLGSKDSAHTS